MQVNGRSGSADIERNMITGCHGCHNAGSDLICHIPVSRHTVAAHKNCIPPAVSHDHCRHIVTDQRHIHPGALQLIGRQSCTLQKGARFIRIHPEPISSFLPQVNRCGCRSVFACGKLSRIAVGQDPIPGLYQAQPIFSNGPAHPDILFLHFLCFRPKPLYDLRNGFSLFVHPAADSVQPVKAPGKIDRRRSG